MNDKYEPPRLNKDISEEEFDQLLESKFGDGFEQPDDRESTKERIVTDRTPAPVDGTNDEVQKGSNDLFSGDAYDYTIPETKEAWIRLKTRVGELEEANLDLRNQLELRDELDESAAGDETEIHELHRELEDVRSELAASVAEKSQLHRELETERQRIVQQDEELNALKPLHLAKQQEVMRLEKELLDLKRILEDERQSQKRRSERHAEELKKKEQLVVDLQVQMANQIQEKTAQVDKLIKEREQEFQDGILAMQKEKNALMEDLQEQLSSLQKYVRELEKEKEDWAHNRDHMAMKLGLLEDEKKQLNEQKSVLEKKNESMNQEIKSLRGNSQSRRQEMKRLMDEMAEVLDKK